MTSSPLSLTIPAKMTADLHRQHSATVRVPVSDTGSLPLTVHVSVADITRLAQQYPGASWVRSVTPSVLVLHPGQTADVVLHVAVPAGAHGTHYVNFIAEGAPSGGRVSGSALHDGVGGTLALDNPGHVTALPVHLATPHRVVPPSSGIPWGPAGGGLLVLAMAGAAAVMGLRRLRRRRAAAGAAEARHGARRSRADYLADPAEPAASDFAWRGDTLRRPEPDAGTVPAIPIGSAHGHARPGRRARRRQRQMTPAEVARLLDAEPTADELATADAFLADLGIRQRTH